MSDRKLAGSKAKTRFSRGHTGFPGTMPGQRRMDFEDALNYGIDGLWMFEADACTDGFHVRKDLLKLNGFAPPADARRKLLRIGREMGVPNKLTKGL